MFFVGIFKVNDENVRIRIRIHIQCHGSATLLKAQSVEDIVAQSSGFCTDKSQRGGSGVCATAPWLPLVDAAFAARPFLPERPEVLVAQGRHSRVPVLLGVNSEEGIYSAAKYIMKPELFAEINAEWDAYGPLYIFDTDQPTPQVGDDVGAG